MTERRNRKKEADRREEWIKKKVNLNEKEEEK